MATTKKLVVTDVNGENIYTIDPAVYAKGGTIKAVDNDTVAIKGNLSDFNIKATSSGVIIQSKTDKSFKVTVTLDKATKGNGFDAGNVKLAFTDGSLDLARGDEKGQYNKIFLADGTELSKKLADGSSVAAQLDPSVVYDDVAQSQPGATNKFTLTNGTDKATANVFDAGLVYTPGGNDRVNALQNEDVLTGTGTNPTLNVTLGNSNDNGQGTVTAQLNNIETINVAFTGNTTTLDLRYSDAVKTLNVDKVTADATAVTLDNITTAAADLRVANMASDDTDVTFTYQRGVLAADGQVANLELSNVLAQDVVQNSRTNVEGFETVNLNAVNGVDINSLSVNEMESLVITGSSFLDIVDLTWTSNEYNQIGAAGGIQTPGAVGLLKLDASAFTGELTLDITSALGGFADPANSGSTVHTVVTGGTGDDVFYARADVAATSATNRDVLDGGTGNNTLVSTAGVDGDASISNIQRLELRQQAGAQTVDFDAFDTNLTSVLMRGEQAGAATWNLNDLSASLAASGLVLRHGITGSTVTTVNATLKADTANDTVAITVENDRNTGTTFNYTINADVATPAGKVDADQGVENVTINDNDTESNVVTLTEADEHTGTITLTGGVAGQTFQVASTLIAATVDASTQKSDLVLNVGEADQTIKLGTGDDVLTFDGLNTFTGADSISDAGGVDTVRAAFSQNVAGAPSLAGIEKLHIVATENTTLDLANAADLTELALLSQQAVDGAGEIFTAALAGVAITDVITLKNTNLSEVNFFGDEDAVVADTTGAPTQTFNGLTLENNATDTVKVNIAAPLTNGTDLAGNGITNYNLGQLTTHGVKNLTIEVANEVEGGATTTIANIWDRDLVNLTLKATGSVNVGTVTGNTVNSNIKTFDASAVGGDVTAVVKALGDNAVVTLAGGNDDFDALGSAGNNVTIQGGEGNNTIRGTAQSDYIYTGAGNDIIRADRGNNTVKSGAGDDIVTALNGSNTVDLGSGKADSVTFAYDTVAQQNLATNVVAGSGTNGVIEFDSNNNGTADTTFGFAVGEGAELSIKFTGTTFDATASTLNGRSATEVTADSAPVAEATQSNLVVLTGIVDQTTAINGGSAADVVLDFRTTGAGATGYTVNTGAGNDAIVISQVSDAGHTINAGAGADRIVLSATAGLAADVLEVAEGDSTATGWDVITNFETGTDQLDLAGVVGITGTALASLSVDLDGDGNDETIALALTGKITVTDGDVVRADNFFGGVFSTESVLNYLASNATVSNEVFFFEVDTNDDGTADSTFVFQNLANDIVVELVGNNNFAVTDVV